MHSRISILYCLKTCGLHLRYPLAQMRPNPPMPSFLSAEFLCGIRTRFPSRPRRRREPWELIESGCDDGFIGIHAVLSQDLPLPPKNRNSRRKNPIHHSRSWWQRPSTWLCRRMNQHSSTSGRTRILSLLTRPHCLHHPLPELRLSYR